jgi:hypothetical protein
MIRHATAPLAMQGKPGTNQSQHHATHDVTRIYERNIVEMPRRASDMSFTIMNPN